MSAMIHQNSLDVLDRPAPSRLNDASVPNIGVPRSDKEEKEALELRAARHILKYIFPRQFGLHNVFTCTLSYWENGGHFRDYSDRETEIKVFG